MKHISHTEHFQSINKGYNATFRMGKLSIGLVVPLENYAHNSAPTMQDHLARVQLAEQLGFTALWLRDVPFNVPAFGDPGQLFDPFVYLGLLAAQTNNIALGVSSIVLPLRHPAHVAKAAASVDVLSNGRLIMGVASGDRPEEYPAMNLNHNERGSRFRESFNYIRHMQTSNPTFTNHYGNFTGSIDMLPKATSNQLPMLITGSSQQSPEWIAKHGDGWMLYPRPINVQQQIISNWREQVKAWQRPAQPVMQPLYFDLAQHGKPQPIHLGFKASTGFLVEQLKALEAVGVNHVALNLRFNQNNIEQTLEQLANDVLPEFTH